MNRTTLIGLCGVVAGVAVGVASSSRVAEAQTPPRPAPVAPLQHQTICNWGRLEDMDPLNAWLAARGREGFAPLPPAATGSVVVVCVTRYAP
jgi:hypothetical protein